MLALNSAEEFIKENALAHGALEQSDVCKESRFSSYYTQYEWREPDLFFTQKNSATATQKTVATNINIETDAWL